MKSVGDDPSGTTRSSTKRAITFASTGIPLEAIKENTAGSESTKITNASPSRTQDTLVSSSNKFHTTETYFASNKNSNNSSSSSPPSSTQTPHSLTTFGSMTNIKPTKVQPPPSVSQPQPTLALQPNL